MSFLRGAKKMVDLCKKKTEAINLSVAMENLPFGIASF